MFNIDLRKPETLLITSLTKHFHISENVKLFSELLKPHGTLSLNKLNIVQVFKVMQ